MWSTASFLAELRQVLQQMQDAGEVMLHDIVIADEFGLSSLRSLKHSSIHALAEDRDVEVLVSPIVISSAAQNPGRSVRRQLLPRLAVMMMRRKKNGLQERKSLGF